MKKILLLGLLWVFQSYSVIQQHEVSQQYVLDAFTQARNPSESACYTELKQLGNVTVNDSSNTCTSYNFTVVSETGGMCEVGGTGGGGTTFTPTPANLYSSVKDIIEVGSNCEISEDDIADTVTINCTGGGGTTETGETIRDKLKTLTNEKRLDATAIKNRFHIPGESLSEYNWSARTVSPLDGQVIVVETNSVISAILFDYQNLAAENNSGRLGDVEIDDVINLDDRGLYKVTSVVTNNINYRRFNVTVEAGFNTRQQYIDASFNNQSIDPILLQYNPVDLQGNWNETDTTSIKYIENKPSAQILAGNSYVTYDELGETALLSLPGGATARWTGTGITVPDEVHWIFVDLAIGHATFEVINWDFVKDLPVSTVGAVVTSSNAETILLESTTNIILRIGHTSSGEVLLSPNTGASTITIPALMWNVPTAPKGDKGDKGDPGTGGSEANTASQIKLLLESLSGTARLEASAVQNLPTDSQKEIDIRNQITVTREGGTILQQYVTDPRDLINGRETSFVGLVGVNNVGWFTYVTRASVGTIIKIQNISNNSTPNTQNFNISQNIRGLGSYLNELYYFSSTGSLHKRTIGSALGEKVDIKTDYVTADRINNITGAMIVTETKIYALNTNLNLVQVFNRITGERLTSLDFSVDSGARNGLLGDGELDDTLLHIWIWTLISNNTFVRAYDLEGTRQTSLESTNINFPLIYPGLNSGSTPLLGIASNFHNETTVALTVFSYNNSNKSNQFRRYAPNLGGTVVTDVAVNDKFSLDSGTVDASGFTGNFLTTDDTLQELFNKIDDFSLDAGGGGGTVSSDDTLEGTGESSDPLKVTHPIHEPQSSGSLELPTANDVGELATIGQNIRIAKKITATSPSVMYEDNYNPYASDSTINYRGVVDNYYNWTGPALHDAVYAKNQHGFYVYNGSPDGWTFPTPQPRNVRGNYSNKAEADQHVSALNQVVEFNNQLHRVTSLIPGTTDSYTWDQLQEIKDLQNKSTLPVLSEIFSNHDLRGLPTTLTINDPSWTSPEFNSEFFNLSVLQDTDWDIQLNVCLAVGPIINGTDMRVDFIFKGSGGILTPIPDVTVERIVGLSSTTNYPCTSINVRDENIDLDIYKTVQIKVTRVSGDAVPILINNTEGNTEVRLSLSPNINRDSGLENIASNTNLNRYYNASGGTRHGLRPFLSWNGQGQPSGLTTGEFNIFTYSSITGNITNVIQLYFDFSDGRVYKRSQQSTGGQLNFDITADWVLLFEPLSRGQAHNISLVPTLVEKTTELSFTTAQNWRDATSTEAELHVGIVCSSNPSSLTFKSSHAYSNTDVGDRFITIKIPIDNDIHNYRLDLTDPARYGSGSHYVQGNTLKHIEDTTSHSYYCGEVYSIQSFQTLTIDYDEVLVDHTTYAGKTFASKQETDTSNFGKNIPTSANTTQKALEALNSASSASNVDYISQGATLTVGHKGDDNGVSLEGSDPFGSVGNAVFKERGYLYFVVQQGTQTRISFGMVTPKWNYPKKITVDEKVIDVPTGLTVHTSNGTLDGEAVNFSYIHIEASDFTDVTRWDSYLGFELNSRHSFNIQRSNGIWLFQVPIGIEDSVDVLPTIEHQHNKLYYLRKDHSNPHIRNDTTVTVGDLGGGYYGWASGDGHYFSNAGGSLLDDDHPDLLEIAWKAETNGSSLRLSSRKDIRRFYIGDNIPTFTGNSRGVTNGIIHVQYSLSSSFSSESRTPGNTLSLNVQFSDGTWAFVGVDTTKGFFDSLAKNEFEKIDLFDVMRSDVETPLRVSSLPSTARTGQRVYLTKDFNPRGIIDFTIGAGTGGSDGYSNSATAGFITQVIGSLNIPGLDELGITKTNDASYVGSTSQLGGNSIIHNITHIVVGNKEYLLSAATLSADPSSLYKTIVDEDGNNLTEENSPWDEYEVGDVYKIGFRSRTGDHKGLTFDLPRADYRWNGSAWVRVRLLDNAHWDILNDLGKKKRNDKDDVTVVADTSTIGFEKGNPNFTNPPEDWPSNVNELFYGRTAQSNTNLRHRFYFSVDEGASDRSYQDKKLVWNGTEYTLEYYIREGGDRNIYRTTVQYSGSISQTEWDGVNLEDVAAEAVDYLTGTDWLYSHDLSDQQDVETTTEAEEETITSTTDLNFIWNGPNNNKETSYSVSEPHTSGSGILARIEDINVDAYTIVPTDVVAESFILNQSFSNTTVNPWNMYHITAASSPAIFSFASRVFAEFNVEYEGFHEDLRDHIAIVMRNSSSEIRYFMLSEATRLGTGRYQFPTDTSKYFTGANIDVAIIDTSNTSIVLAWIFFDDKQKICLAEVEVEDKKEFILDEAA